MTSSEDAPQDATPATETKTTQWTEKSAIDYASFNPDTGLDFGSNARVYTFTGETGHIGDADPELEKILYNDTTKPGVGKNLDALELEPHIEGPHRIEAFRNFSEAGLHPTVLGNTKLCKYDFPTCIQAYCIPAILQDHDVVAVAQTGSGKTAAYLIPIMSKLMGKVDKIGGPRIIPGSGDRVVAQPLVLIICPTRELAQQIFDETRRLAYRSKLRPVCAYGGVPKRYNLQQLQQGCDILIGTPGRLCDLIDNHGNALNMNNIRFTVIDEADEMLQQDWEEELGKLVACATHADHQIFMFSATFPKEARALAREYLSPEYVRIRIGRAGSSHKNVEQHVVLAARDDKPAATLELLNSIPPGLTMIFCNSVPGVEYLDDFLYNQNGFPTTFIHSKRNQYEREDAMRSFKLAKSPILITTGVSARGIDVSGIMHVINYDLPSVSNGGVQEYVHRIGRTGRIGHKGLATALYDPDRDADIAEDLVKLLLETQQPIPDFLDEYKPEDGAIDFADDTDDEDAVEGGGCGGAPVDDTAPAAAAWGGDDGAAAAETSSPWGGDAPGATEEAPAAW